VAEVAQLVKRWRTSVLIPITEASVLSLLPERDQLDDVCIPIAPYNRFWSVSDKLCVLDAARQLRIPVPQQHVLFTAQDRKLASWNSLGFPVVVKPARSVSVASGGLTKSEVAHAVDAESLQRVLGRMEPTSYPLMVQRRVGGPGIGVFILMWDGEVIAAFGHRRIREKPPAGGVSVYRESIAVSEELLGQSVRLLRMFEWQGVAMVEYKVDAATDTAYLMEVNGRFWGSLQLAIDAGVDFPALLVAACLGERPPPVMAYECGVRSRWWWGDVDHLIARLRRSRGTLALPETAPGRVRTVVDFVASVRPGVRSEVLRLRDPQPFVRETMDWLRGR
jgi:predicted ATP-grasp superfamily ATP-dependent carboligase